jgi:hypothetical protein
LYARKIFIKSRLALRYNKKKELDDRLCILIGCRINRFILAVIFIMNCAKQEIIKPIALLYDLRRSVSEILNKPFTERINHQVFKPDQRILAFWAADCAERVLPYFENEYPKDGRPRKAVEACRAWARTGVFSMAVIRDASLSAHAAARDAKGNDSACYAAHAAGQAVATAHVPTHALGSSIYAIRAVASHSGNMEEGPITERNWQLERLREYTASSFK